MCGDVYGTGELCHVMLLNLIFTAVRASDKRITCDEEFSDSEDEGEGGRKHVENYKSKRIKLDEKGDAGINSTVTTVTDKGIIRCNFIIVIYSLSSISGYPSPDQILLPPV